MLQEDFEVARVEQVVLLVITPVGRLDLVHQPADVLRPTEVLRLDDHAEPGVLEERMAGSLGLGVRAVDRDHHAQVAMGLLADRVERPGHEVTPAVDRDSQRDGLAVAHATASTRSAVTRANSGAVVSFPVSIEW